MTLYRLQKDGEVLSVKCSIMDWKNTILFAAAKDFLLEEKWLQHEADAHLHTALCLRMLGNLIHPLECLHNAEQR
jgi:hypothetical protein